ncbi:spermidine/putrescine ABC transporter permease [Elstera litoralis]|uniref:Spermidine/putrescine ABC transporter permease n=1 Tax=Elstera litoralis TaxID=552518 RepID=A0A0F3IWS1_9PROT|nr:ABC transporter permease [Elstera litoralis]KJV11072.1 spermidine/putrescine ABC transporter permease [Elstera litoralis]
MVSWLPRAMLLACVAFLILGPLSNILIWAFAEQWFFPAKLPTEWGFKFWERVFRPRAGAMDAMTMSLVIALLTVAVSMLLAVPAGYALARRSIPCRALVMLAFLLPQAIPSVAVHQSIGQIFYTIGLNGTVPGVVLVHTLHGLVFAVWITSAAFASVDRDLEAAARDLGATPGQVFRSITLPLAFPGLIASAIFVFLGSIDEFTGTFFVGVPDIQTLPILLYTASMQGSYQIASITAIFLLIPSLLFMVIVERFLKADVAAKIGT